MKVYISGPMTGLPDFNYPAFMEAEKKLRKLGFEVINPARIKHRDKNDWATCMRQAITEMMQADIIAMLPMWEHSRGARIENGLAIQLLIPVDYETLAEGADN